jgi:hypothetical protein
VLHNTEINSIVITGEMQKKKKKTEITSDAYINSYTNLNFGNQRKNNLIDFLRREGKEGGGGGVQNRA